MTKEKTVLVVFRNRRRPVTFASGKTPKEEHQNLFEAVVRDFYDVLESNEGSSSMGNYYLQRESKEWGGCIDVTGSVQERDVIHLCVSSSAAASEVTLIYCIIGIGVHLLL